MLDYLPLYGALGLTCGLMAAVCTGSTFALLPSFDPLRALEIVVAQDIPVIEAPPTIYTEMLAASEGFGLDFRSLRVCISGGPAHA